MGGFGVEMSFIERLRLSSQKWIQRRAYPLPVFKLEPNFKVTEQLATPFTLFGSVNRRLLQGIASELKRITDRYPGLAAHLYYGESPDDSACARPWMHSNQLRCGIQVSLGATSSERLYETEHELGHTLTYLRGVPMGISPKINELFSWLQSFGTHPAVDQTIVECGGDHLPRQRRNMELILATGWRESNELFDPIMLGCAIFDACRPVPEYREAALRMARSASKTAAEAFVTIWVRYEETKNEILTPSGVKRFVELCMQDFGVGGGARLITIDELIAEGDKPPCRDAPASMS